MRLFVPLLAAAAAMPTDAAVLTVGPGGSHATLQDALSAAAATSADDEIRITVGTHAGGFLSQSTAQVLQISGGWDASFATRGDDPAATIVQGAGGADSALGLLVTMGAVELSNLTLRHPASTRASGSCMEADVRGTSLVRAQGIVVRDCNATVPSGCYGAGINGIVRNSAALELIGSRVADNRCRAMPPDVAGGPGNSGAGAGAELVAMDDSHLLVRDTVFENNELDVPGGQGDGAGLRLALHGNAQGNFTANRILGNHVRGADFGDYATVSNGYGLAIQVGIGGADTAQLSARGNIVHGNTMESTIRIGSQVVAGAGGASVLTLGDTAITDGDGGPGGLTVSAIDPASTLHLANLTIAGHDGPGLVAYAYNLGTITLHNSVLAHNDAEPILAAAIDQQDNLIEDSGGADPQFRDAAGGDYRLGAASPARDAGTATPAGGLGATDANGGLRLVGPAPDIGAYEFGGQAVFANGFETP